MRQLVQRFISYNMTVLDKVQITFLHIVNKVKTQKQILLTLRGVKPLI